MSEEHKGGLGDLIGKAKGFLTDENIDTAAEKIKSVAPDSIDSAVDTVAEQAKKLNG